MRDDRKTLGDAIVDSPAWDRRDPRFRQLLTITKDAEGKPVGKAHPFSAHERNGFFTNMGDGVGFADLAAISGTDTGADSRGMALLDYDRDGDQDMALVNANNPSFNLFRTSVPTPGNFIAVRLVGGARAGEKSEERLSNRDAIGARVTVTTGSGRELMRVLNAGEGYGAQNSKTLIIGLGADGVAKSVRVDWPSGNDFQTESAVAHGKLLRVEEGVGEARSSYIPPN